MAEYGKIHVCLKATLASPLPRWLGRDVGATLHLTGGGRIKHLLLSSIFGFSSFKSNVKWGIAQRMRRCGFRLPNSAHFSLVLLPLCISKKELNSSHLPPPRTQSHLLLCADLCFSFLGFANSMQLPDKRNIIFTWVHNTKIWRSWKVKWELGFAWNVVGLWSVWFWIRMVCMTMIHAPGFNDSKRIKMRLISCLWRLYHCYQTEVGEGSSLYARNSISDKYLKQSDYHC